MELWHLVFPKTVEHLSCMQLVWNIFSSQKFHWPTQKPFWPNRASNWLPGISKQFFWSVPQNLGQNNAGRGSPLCRFLWPTNYPPPLPSIFGVPWSHTARRNEKTALIDLEGKIGMAAMQSCNKNHQKKLFMKHRNLADLFLYKLYSRYMLYNIYVPQKNTFDYICTRVFLCTWCI